MPSGESTETHEPAVTFERHPSSYRHWKLTIEPPIATLTLAVDAAGGLRGDYELKLNSYDLSVDIELADAVQRLRFEHPEVGAVVVTGGLDKVFCAGANIQMLASASHHHKVNFCKFTNETRNAIEASNTESGIRWLAAVNGTAAGGGYELALACDEIVLIDDRASAVSLPEVALLAVLPGTGGLTRVVDKRHVRRDLADVFATRTEGVRGQQAVDWGLVDAVAPRSQFDAVVHERALALAERSDRPTSGDATGLSLAALSRSVSADGSEIQYVHVSARLDRAVSAAHITVTAPSGDGPDTVDTVEALAAAGAEFWPLAVCRELDDLMLHLRFNEPEIGTWVIRTSGEPGAVTATDDLLTANADHWLVREITSYWTRTLKRLDLSARTILTLVEPGSCFAGPLAELVLAADRTFMLDGTWPDADEAPATLVLTPTNDGRHPMSNGLSRLASRFYGHDDELAMVRSQFGKELLAADAAELGLVTFTPDDLDWDDEVRLMLEERASFSPDALTGMEANLRFVGPETMETKIFARLSAWQNWIFQRPNAVGPDGALRRFGSGTRPTYDKRRV